MTERAYGQQDQMEHPSMVGTLRTQAEMIWPLERPVLERLGIPRARALLDVGTGIGAIAGRIARTWPSVRVTGLDLFEGHLAIARKEHPLVEVPNLRFVNADARKLPFEDRWFDAVVARHVLHALEDVDQVLREVMRVLRSGGTFYELAEDYMGMLVDADDPDARMLYLDVSPGMLRQGTDLLHGRSAYRRFVAAGFQGVRVEPIVVDTIRSSRETFARMLEYWRDGYAGHLAKALGQPPAEIVRRFDGQIDAVRDPKRYSCWLLLAVSGTKP